MNRIAEQFQKSLEKKESTDGWDRIYVAVDIHETVLEPNYGGISKDFYPYSKEVLRYLTERDDVILIMWTCSKDNDRKYYDQLLKDNGIVFDYINDNPEVKGKLSWGDYDTKMYVNVGLDDKFGFKFIEDWLALYLYFQLDSKDESEPSGSLDHFRQLASKNVWSMVIEDNYRGYYMTGEKCTVTVDEDNLININSKKQNLQFDITAAEKMNVKKDGSIHFLLMDYDCGDEKHINLKVS